MLKQEGLFHPSPAPSRPMLSHRLPPIEVIERRHRNRRKTFLGQDIRDFTAKKGKNFGTDYTDCTDKEHRATLGINVSIGTGEATSTLVSSLSPYCHGPKASPLDSGSARDSKLQEQDLSVRASMSVYTVKVNCKKQLSAD